MIGLRGMDSIHDDILFRFVQPLEAAVSSSPLTPIASNHRLFSRFLPKINSRFHGRIFGVVFYTAGRNQDDRFANEVYTRGVLKTRRAIDPSTVGYEPNTSIKNGSEDYPRACNIDTGFSTKMFKTICYSG